MTALPPSVEKTVASEIAKGPQGDHLAAFQDWGRRIALLQAETDARICEDVDAQSEVGDELKMCAAAIRANAAALQTTPEQQVGPQTGSTQTQSAERVNQSPASGTHAQQERRRNADRALKERAIEIYGADRRQPPEAARVTEGPTLEEVAAAMKWLPALENEASPRNGPMLRNEFILLARAILRWRDERRERGE